MLIFAADAGKRNGKAVSSKLRRSLLPEGSKHGQDS